VQSTRGPRTGIAWRTCPNQRSLRIPTPTRAIRLAPRHDGSKSAALFLLRPPRYICVFIIWTFPATLVSYYSVVIQGLTLLRKNTWAFVIVKRSTRKYSQETRRRHTIIQKFRERVQIASRIPDDTQRRSVIGHDSRYIVKWTDETRSPKHASQTNASRLRKGTVRFVGAQEPPCCRGSQSSGRRRCCAWSSSGISPNPLR